MTIYSVAVDRTLNLAIERRTLHQINWYLFYRRNCMKSCSNLGPGLF